MGKLKNDPRQKGLLRTITLKISLFQTAVSMQSLELDYNYGKESNAQPRDTK